MKRTKEIIKGNYIIQSTSHVEHRADTIYDLLKQFEYSIVRANLMIQGFRIVVRGEQEYVVIPNISVNTFRALFGPVLVENYRTNDCLFLNADCCRDEEGALMPHLGSADYERIRTINEKVSCTPYARLVEYVESREKPLILRGRLLLVPKDITPEYFDHLENQYLLKKDISNSLGSEGGTAVSITNIAHSSPIEVIVEETTALQNSSKNIQSAFEEVIKDVNNCDSIIIEEEKPSNEEVKRVDREVSQFARNTSIVNKLKALYEDTCQVCCSVTDLGLGDTMSEVHHIRPLGNAHDGPDNESNMIVVCPTHHAMFDAGAITIDLRAKRVIHVNKSNPIHRHRLLIKHDIEVIHVEYHNEKILKKLSTKGIRSSI